MQSGYVAVMSISINQHVIRLNPLMGGQSLTHQHEAAELEYLRELAAHAVL